MIVKTLRITIVLTLQNVLHVHRACVTLHGTFVSRKFVEILKRFPIMAIGVKCSLISIHTGDIAEPATWQSPTTMRGPKKGDD